MKRTVYTEEHEDFRAMIRDFIAREVKPHFEQWERDNLVPRELYRRLGEIEVMGFDVPEEYGGLRQAGGRLPEHQIRPRLVRRCNERGVGLVARRAAANR
ncbi:acyl-CoA dehydrogenase family protein [Streptomyces sp. NBC_01280]|uniref:acyl-CoA dehydrogenase family protein n=1 Tax=Streptomyces sp. NBC_01280 TaxID=2903810 RepID=UPI002E32C7D3|nr:acyl-CoA dehydrogenase family protein [Streptomyces sp. NBC_01280]